MSPFKSKAQARFMFAKKPKTARDWAEKTDSIKDLPEHKDTTLSAAFKKALKKRGK